MTPAPLRVLQVLPHTDADDAGRRAVALHGALARRGLDVRTVALGPGRAGGLDADVPVLSPSPGSWSARTQLRRERRWADVVVLHGAASRWASSRLLAGGPPVVAAAEGPAGGPRPWPTPPVAGVDVVVATVGGSGPSGEGGPAGDTPDPGTPAPGAVPRAVPAVVGVPAAVDVRRPPTTVAARRVARQELGLPPDAPVVQLVGGDGSAASGAAGRWRAAVAASGGSVRPDGPVTVPASAGRGGPPGGEPGELLAAAVDVVVWVDADPVAPVPLDVLAAAAGGAAVVVDGPVPPAGWEGVVVPAGGGPDGAEAALAALGDRSVRSDRGAAAADLVRRRHDLDAVAATWEHVLRRAAVGPAR